VTWREWLSYLGIKLVEWLAHDPGEPKPAPVEEREPVKYGKRVK
jgi:hypothetical protein